MKGAVIYARFSTEHQNEKSVEDQFDCVCSTLLNAGTGSSEISEIEACSGTSMLGRDGLAEVMRRAELREFDVLIVRLSIACPET